MEGCSSQGEKGTPHQCTTKSFILWYKAAKFWCAIQKFSPKKTFYTLRHSIWVWSLTQLFLANHVTTDNTPWFRVANIAKPIPIQARLIYHFRDTLGFFRPKLSELAVILVKWFFTTHFIFGIFAINRSELLLFLHKHAKKAIDGAFWIHFSQKIQQHFAKKKIKIEAFEEISMARGENSSFLASKLNEPVATNCTWYH